MDSRLDSFRQAAEAYRRTLEEAGTVADFARRVRNAVARVYLAGVFLPEGDSDAEELPEPTAQRREPLELEERVAVALERDAYAVVWNPFEVEDDDPITGSLSLELGEIYDDLGRALALLERGMPDDLWQVRWDFEEHWGGHAVNMLRPLHHLATGR